MLIHVYTREELDDLLVEYYNSLERKHLRFGQWLIGLQRYNVGVADPALFYRNTTPEEICEFILQRQEEFE